MSAGHAGLYGCHPVGIASLAQDLEWAGQEEFADRSQALLDEFRAEAKVLAAYPPGVMVDARMVGRRLLDLFSESAAEPPGGIDDGAEGDRPHDRAVDARAGVW
ncbi:hypothetical protein ACFVMC_00455 [Nocardia sp. NPDC127579]|uniref:hypothetical protein n=1 Tax=Nocardia sp. NPDC127579 TaxID=3345402 RepID=UPI003636C542